jgi:hypothetical protein
MIERRARDLIEQALRDFPVVALLGSRQAGKTTLAREVVRRREARAIYLDLELPSDAARLAEAEIYLEHHSGALVVLDEIQRVPDLFPVLRGLVDRRRRAGRFLVLGSASPALLRQASESLAGRITYIELPPFSLTEVADRGTMADTTLRRLWLRGGYPQSFLARSEQASRNWREAFIKSFLERDVPEFGIRIASTRLRRFWEMLAHVHGQVWNASAFAQNFDVSAPTVRHYLDVLSDLFVVRQLQPLATNLKKRLVKAPKVYIRDSGLRHTLLRIASLEELHGHPALGSSFEGFAIEQILELVPATCDVAFYRTHTGVEIDLVLSPSGRRRIGVEIKFTAAPRVTQGLRLAMQETGCTEGYVVTAGRATFPLGNRMHAMPLAAFLRDIAEPLAARSRRSRPK